MARKIEVQIVGDSSSLHKALGDVTARSKRFGSVLGSSLRVGSIAATAGIVGLSFAAKELTEAGSDMNETLNKSRVIFGKSSKGVQSWAETMAEAGGISKQAALDSAAMFGTFGKSAGVGQKKLDSWSESLVQAASDLSSFHNADPTQVLEDIRSGLAGETEPLRKYGILMNDAALRTQALKMGLVSTTKDALSPANKMMAAQALILKSLGPAAGDFARTSTGLANQQRILKAELQNVVSELGMALLPIIVKVARFAIPLVISVVKNLADAIGGAIQWIGKFANHFQVLGGKSASAGTRIRNAFEHVRDFFRAEIFPVVHRLQGIFQEAMANIAKVVQQNGPAIRRIFDRVGGAIKAIGNVAIPILRFALTSVLPQIIDKAIKFLDNLTKGIQRVVGWIKRVGNTSGFRHVVSDIQTMISWINSAISKVQDLIGWINRIPSVNTSLLDIAGINPNKGLLTQGKTTLLGGGIEQGALSGLTGRGAQGRPNPTVVHVMLDGKVLATAMANENTQFKRQNGGRSRFA